MVVVVLGQSGVEVEVEVEVGWACYRVIGGSVSIEYVLKSTHYSRSLFCTIVPASSLLVLCLFWIRRHFWLFARCLCWLCLRGVGGVLGARCWNWIPLLRTRHCRCGCHCCRRLCLCLCRCRCRWLWLCRRQCLCLLFYSNRTT